MGVKVKRRAPQLSAEDWIHATLETLLEEGPKGVRIANIARRLRVTTGSFYWHFRDRNHLRDRALRCWQKMVNEAGASAEEARQGNEKLRALPMIITMRKLPDLDAAIRAWGQTDPVVAKQVAKADVLRIRRVEAMLQAAGLDEATATRRAPLLLWAHIGSIGCDPAVRGPALAELVEVLVSPGKRTLPAERRTLSESVQAV